MQIPADCLAFAEPGDILTLVDAQALGLDPAGFPNDGDAGMESEG